MKYLTLILAALFILLSSQSSTLQFPYKGQPMYVQMRDTDNVEISYIFFDPVTKKVVVRGSLEQGLMHMNNVYQEQLAPAQMLNDAAGKVRFYLNANGTVRRRDSLTMAIRAYDSIRAKWGIIQ